MTEPMSRRRLIKTFGLSALLIHPVLRSMAYAAPVPFDKAPRYIMFFKGGAYYPSRTNPTSLSDLSRTPIAPLQAHASDIMLFKGMNIHGGSPKTNGYKEEHAGGLFGCTTGHSYKYFKNDAYFAYTDHESIDVHIAGKYAERPELGHIPIKSLHIGGGAHSDSDQSGSGNRFISFRNRKPGDPGYWGNAIEPVQDSGRVYEMLMQAAAATCSAQSNQPRSDAAKVAAAMSGRKSLADFMVADVRQAKLTFGMDSEHARKLDGMLENWSEAAKSAGRSAKVETVAAGGSAGKPCATLARPTGNGANKKNLDDLSPVHDQMINLIRLAFENDLTRVVAFTLSGASSGQTWPSRGINKAHHTLEHSGDVESLVKIDTYYSEKFASLLSALKSIDDGGGRSALYNSSVFLGMECWSNSSSGHYMTNVPFILAGQGGGAFKGRTGQIVQAGGRNVNDVHLSCLHAAGIRSAAFGLDSLCKGPIV
jgi:hypothetical protein